MRKFLAACLGASALTFGLVAPASADLACNIPVPEGATVVSYGAADCIVGYKTLGEAAEVVHASMVSGKYVWPADESGFIADSGGYFVVRVSDVNPNAPLQVVLAPA